MCDMELGKEQQCGMLSRHCVQHIMKGQVSLRDCAPEEDPSGPPEQKQMHNTCRSHRGFEVCFCKGDMCNGKLPPCGVRLRKKDGACLSETEIQKENEMEKKKEDPENHQ